MDERENRRLVALWPRVPDERCHACNHRGWVTWTRDAYRLCDECLAIARAARP